MGEANAARRGRFYAFGGPIREALLHPDRSGSGPGPSARIKAGPAARGGARGRGSQAHSERSGCGRDLARPRASSSTRLLLWGLRPLAGMEWCLYGLLRGFASGWVALVACRQSRRLALSSAGRVAATESLGPAEMSVGGLSVQRAQHSSSLFTEYDTETCVAGKRVISGGLWKWSCLLIWAGVDALGIALAQALVTHSFPV